MNTLAKRIGYLTAFVFVFCSLSSAQWSAYDVDSVALDSVPTKDGTFKKTKFCKFSFVKIKAGAVMLQDKKYETSGHSASISAFRISSTEITQEQYKAVMGINPSFFGGDTGKTRPVEMVSWYEAALFCNALSAMSGLDTGYVYSGAIGAGVSIDYTKNGYRLPTEAEWEYACRGGTATDFYWEKNYPIAQAADTSAADNNAVWFHNSKSTQPVGSKMPNPFGLYDMSGNVWEWCNDWYASYASAAQADPTGPTAPSDCRVVRGGAYNGVDAALRSADRTYGSPGYRYNRVGFRIVARP